MTGQAHTRVRVAQATAAAVPGAARVALYLEAGHFPNSGGDSIFVPVTAAAVRFRQQAGRPLHAACGDRKVS